MSDVCRWYVQLAEAQLSPKTAHLFFTTVESFMTMEGGKCVIDLLQVHVTDSSTDGSFRELTAIGDDSLAKAYAQLFQTYRH